MNNVIKYGGWIALLIVIFVGAFVFNSRMATERARAVEARQTAEEALEKVQAEKSALQEEIAALKSAQVAAQVPMVEPQATLPSDVPEAVAPAPVVEAEPAPNSEVSDDSERGERVANAQLAMVAEMMYQGLFDDLQLSPEVRAALKDAIAVHMKTMQQATVAAMGAKNETAKAFHARMEAMKAGMRDELAQTLTPEQLNAWDEYEPVADQMLYERLVDGQLNMLAPGLTNENRVLASQVVAEELVRELDALGQSDEIYSVDSHNGAQARALNASLDRLAGELDEEQYRYVQGYVNQAVAMFDAMKGR